MDGEDRATPGAVAKGDTGVKAEEQWQRKFNCRNTTIFIHSRSRITVGIS